MNRHDQEKSEQEFRDEFLPDVNLNEYLSGEHVSREEHLKMRRRFYQELTSQKHPTRIDVPNHYSHLVKRKVYLNTDISKNAAVHNKFNSAAEMINGLPATYVNPSSQKRWLGDFERRPNDGMSNYLPALPRTASSRTFLSPLSEEFSVREVALRSFKDFRVPVNEGFGFNFTGDVARGNEHRSLNVSLDRNIYLPSLTATEQAPQPYTSRRHDTLSALISAQPFNTEDSTAKSYRFNSEEKQDSKHFNLEENNNFPLHDKHIPNTNKHANPSLHTPLPMAKSSMISKDFQLSSDKRSSAYSSQNNFSHIRPLSSDDLITTSSAQSNKNQSISSFIAQSVSNSKNQANRLNNLSERHMPNSTKGLLANTSSLSPIHFLDFKPFLTDHDEVKLLDANKSEVAFDLIASLDGKFYCNEKHMNVDSNDKKRMPIACYRRNFSSLLIAIETSEKPKYLEIKGTLYDIESLQVSLNCFSNFSGSPVDITFFSNKAKIKEYIDMEGCDVDIGLPTGLVKVLLKKFQFTKATPNNGKSIAKDYYYLQLNLNAVVRDSIEEGTETNNKRKLPLHISLKTLKSNGISVRGRNPSFYTEREDIGISKEKSQCFNLFYSP